MGLSMQRYFSLSNLTAGLVAVLVGFTSSVALIFQAASSAGASTAEIGSWLLALGIGMGIISIGLSLYYKMPILGAWSTTGAALLITSLHGVSMSDAIGAFVFAAVLVIICGVTGLFKKIILYIPRQIASAMLAGILIHFGINVFNAMKNEFTLGLVMIIAYLIGKRIFPRFVILFVFALGVLVAQISGLLHLQTVHLEISSPIFIMPTFSPAVLLSVGIPLFVVTMTSQNIPGITVLNAAGYNPPISPLITWTGVINILFAPFGGFSFNLAAITAAICLSKEAEPNTALRYRATIAAGIWYIIIGIFGATVVAIFSILPIELLSIIGGLALFGTIGISLKAAVEDEYSREPALITLLISASGLSIFGISSALLGLATGIFAHILLNISKK